MKRFLNMVADIFYPRCCPVCQKILKDQRRMICPECEKKLRPIGHPRCYKCGKPIEEGEYCKDCQKHTHIFDQGRGLWIQKQPVSRAIYQFKFHNKRYYASVFAEEMMKRYGEWIYRNEIKEIIPIPLYKAKQRKRGFNQALLIAKELSILSGIPVNENAVFRIRNTKPQKILNPMERSRNLKGAFGVKKTWEVKNKVLLIDDIYTTGSTMDRVAKVLKKAGAQKVYFLTISIGQGL